MLLACFPSLFSIWQGNAGWLRSRLPIPYHCDRQWSRGREHWLRNYWSLQAKWDTVHSIIFSCLSTTRQFTLIFLSSFFFLVIALSRKSQNKCKTNEVLCRHANVCCRFSLSFLELLQLISFVLVMLFWGRVQGDHECSCESLRAWSACIRCTSHILCLLISTLIFTLCILCCECSSISSLSWISSFKACKARSQIDLRIG